MAQTNEITGGEAMARTLKAFHAGPMFGMGGFQLLAFYDAARRLELDHHLINDERCGTFAADAYAKVSGRVGLVDATLGPGATNLVTGLIEALNAGTPLVAFIGDTHRAHSWKNMTQEARQTEILKPACKELIRIEHASRIPELIARAFLVATSGRPGPVVVDVPEDVCHGTLPFHEEAYAVDPRYEAAPAIRCRPAADDTARAARLLSEAKRPLMLCGGGVHISQAAADVAAFATANGIPVAHTMTGKGADCLHRSAERGPVRSLRPHRQQADRRGGRSAGGGLQAGRDRHQALHDSAARQDRDPSRYRGGGVRAHLSAHRRVVGRRARGRAGPGRGARRRCQAAQGRRARPMPAMCRSGWRRGAPASWSASPLASGRSTWPA